MNIHQFLICLIIILLKNDLSAQTTLSPGDIVVTAFKTNGNTQSGDDAVKFVTLVDLQCNTQFIVTDNNWNSITSSWVCNDDEFGISVTCTSPIAAGSVFYLDADISAGVLTCSGGTATKTNLGSPWGTNFGLNSGGDNLYILQGTRSSPTFIFAFKHSGSFSAGTCASKDNASLPLGLSIGTSALIMPSSQDQWNFNCVTNSGTKSALQAAIGNTANWVSNTSHVWDESSCIFKVTNGVIPYGTLAVSGAGCGCLANCQLAYSGGINCGSTGITGNCTAGYQNMSATIAVPSTCTYQVIAEMKARNFGCSSSGADGNCQTCDVVKVDVSGGTKAFQQGGSNAAITDNYTLAGPGNIIVSGRADRADEIITYSIIISSCSCLTTVLPIELTEFTVKKVEESVELNWITASEKDNEYFSIERSLDADTWETIYVIASQGNSTSNYYYSVFDNKPAQQLLYYRLKQTDKKGSFKYSNIIYINNGLSNNLKLIKCVNIYGQEVSEDSIGLLIFIYDNGQVKKVYK